MPAFIKLLKIISFIMKIGTHQCIRSFFTGLERSFQSSIVIGQSCLLALKLKANSFIFITRFKLIKSLLVIHMLSERHGPHPYICILDSTAFYVSFQKPVHHQLGNTLQFNQQWKLLDTLAIQFYHLLCRIAEFFGKSVQVSNCEFVPVFLFTKQ